MSDFRLALRTMRREWTSSLFIVITLALAIGANAALFGIVDRLLLTGPERIPNAERVLRVYWTRFEGPRLTTSSVFDYSAIEALDGAPAIQSVAAYVSLPGTFGRGRDARQVTIAYVSNRYFTALGTPSFVGQTLDAAGKDLPSSNATVISYGLWRSAFGGSANVLGRTVVLDERSFRIVGIMPQGFTGAEATTTDFWLPVDNIESVIGTGWRTRWDAPWARIVVRLDRAAQLDQAQQEATARFRHAYAGADSSSRRTTLTMKPLTRNPQGRLSAEQSMSLWLSCLSIIVLLVAIVNVSNLLSARAIRRSTSLGVRVALGASRAGILRLFVAEGILLAFAAGIGSVAVAYAVGVTLRRELPPTIDWTSPVINPRMAVVVLCSILVIGVAVAIIPARRVFSLNLSALLHDGRRGASATSPRRTPTAIQSTLSMTLLVIAGLFLRSVLIARAIDFGIEPHSVASVLIRWPRVPRNDQPEWARRTRFLRSVVERLRANPDFESASIVTGYPLGRSDRARLIADSGPMHDRLIQPTPAMYVVSDGYFETVGTRIAEGRPIDASDLKTSEPVAIVSQSLAAQLWPGGSALGQCVHLATHSNACVRIVGVAADTRASMRDTTTTQVYVPLTQSQPDNMWLLIRSALPLGRLEPRIRNDLAKMDPTIDYIQVSSLESSLEPTLRPWKLGTMVIGLIGTLAFVIAAVGLYGVVSYETVRREHEFGLRRALGASPSHLLTLMMHRTVGATAVGVVAGGVIAIVAAQRMKSMFYAGVEREPMVILIVATILLTTAIVAAGVPAVRTLRRSPADTLRAD